MEGETDGAATDAGVGVEVGAGDTTGGLTCVGGTGSSGSEVFSSDAAEMLDDRAGVSTGISGFDAVEEGTGGSEGAVSFSTFISDGDGLAGGASSPPWF